MNQKSTRRGHLPAWKTNGVERGASRFRAGSFRTRRSRARLLLSAASALVGAVVLGSALSPNAVLAAQESGSAARTPPDTAIEAEALPVADTLLHIVEGTALDQATGDPLAAVVVVLPGLGRTTFTDEFGRFRVKGVPPGRHALTMARIGYETFDGSFVVDGDESVAVLMIPGAIPLDGIEVKVRSREDLEWRASGTRLSVIGPVEMEELSERYFSLGDLLASRVLSGARFVRGTGGRPGCMRSLRGVRTRCSAVVLDGVLLAAGAEDWAYDMNASSIFAVRFVRGPEAGFRYGTAGGAGVLIVETRSGQR